MAEFGYAYEKMIRNEGGYKLHIVREDQGEQTYAGISRKYHPQWPGWRNIDKSDFDNLKLTQQVREFY
jgi:lysozyme family protein